MKNLLASLLLLSLSIQALADDQVGPLKKVSANVATLTITTEDTEGTQAAYFVDGMQIDDFIKMMLEDETSGLAKTVKTILDNNCQEFEDAEEVANMCGTINITSHVMTGFGRGGWMDGTATYTLFIGFTSAGTGRYLQTEYIMSINESAEANVGGEEVDYKYLGTVTKKLSLQKIIPFPNED